MTWVIALGVGLLIGLLLGALGGGGAILAVPVLVYLLGQSPQEATASSLVIVGATAVVSTADHARSGNVRWWTGVGFAVAGVPASLLGSALNARADGVVVLVSFALVMLASAAAMLWRTRRLPPSVPGPAGPAESAEGAEPIEPPSSVSSGLAPSDPEPATPAPSDPEPATPAPSAVPAGRGWVFPNAGLIGKILGVGLLIGFLTGFLGVGGGFIIVPALIAALGMPMSWAVGTSLFITALNSGVSLLPRMGGDYFDWALIVPFTIAAVAGSLVGKAIADRLPATTLTRAFAALLIVAGIGVIVLEVIA